MGRDCNGLPAFEHKGGVDDKDFDEIGVVKAWKRVEKLVKLLEFVIKADGGVEENNVESFIKADDGMQF